MRDKCLVMEPMHAELQPDNFIIGQRDFPFWHEGEPSDSYIELCNSAFSNPFDDISPELSSFGGSMSWMDGHEQLRHANGPVSPFSASPPVEEADLTNSNPVEIQPKDNTASKRKRRQSIGAEATESTNSKLKRVYRPRSTSSSSHIDHSKKEGKANDKEGIILRRSRIASNNFRARKRNEIAHLESEEYNTEDTNRQLRTMLELLTSEILFLKAQLLQHTDCNCELIQAYINQEAHHFVQSLESFTKS